MRQCAYPCTEKQEFRSDSCYCSFRYSTSYSITLLANDKKLHFVPLAIETAGPFGPEAKLLLKDIGKRLQRQTGNYITIYVSR